MPFRRIIAGLAIQQAKRTASRLRAENERLQFEIDRERTKRMDLRERFRRSVQDLRESERDLNMWRDSFYKNHPFAMIEIEKREMKRAGLDGSEDATTDTDDLDEIIVSTTHKGSMDYDRAATDEDSHGLLTLPSVKSGDDGDAAGERSASRLGAPYALPDKETESGQQFLLLLFFAFVAITLAAC